MSEIEKLIDNIQTKDKKITDKKILKIQEEYNKLDENYFKRLKARMESHQKAFDLHKTHINEMFHMMLQIEIEIAEIKHNGYKLILDNPSKVDEISNKIKPQIKFLTDMRDMLKLTAIDFQKKSQLTVDNMLKNGYDKEEIEKKIPSAIFYNEEEWKEITKKLEV